MKSKKITKISLLITLCLMLAYVEVLIPFNFAIPGMKLGLTNIVVLYALYLLDFKSAFIINVIRILLQGLLFSSPLTMAYSLSGGVFSFISMVLVKKINKLSIVSVSVTGGIFHNIGQLVMASIILGSTNVLYYLPFLMIFGIISGILVGFIGGITVERIKKI